MRATATPVRVSHLARGLVGALDRMAEAPDNGHGPDDSEQPGSPPGRHDPQPHLRDRQYRQPDPRGLDQEEPSAGNRTKDHPSQQGHGDQDLLKGQGDWHLPPRWANSVGPAAQKVHPTPSSNATYLRSMDRSPIPRSRSLDSDRKRAPGVTVHRSPTDITSPAPASQPNHGPSPRPDRPPRPRSRCACMCTSGLESQLREPTSPRRGCSKRSPMTYPVSSTSSSPAGPSSSELRCAQSQPP
jgi:hypothetical protein